MRKMLLVLLAMCLVMAACGGQQEDKKAKAELPEKAAAEENFIAPPVRLPGKVENRGTLDRSFQGDRVNVDMEVQNFFFDPSFVRTAPGATVTLRLTNKGNTDHTFNVDTPAIEESLKPGDQRTIEIKLPESGVVNFYCKLHRTQGEQGAFYFKTEGGLAPRDIVPGAGQSTVSPEQQGATPGGPTPEAGM
jgi:plastocyanin